MHILQTTVTEPESMFRCPGEREVAFAICIVHSKPPELTVAEYIRLLRQHVAQGRRENALSSAYRHLDRSSFWRSECDRRQEALRASEEKAVNLQLEIETLKAKIEGAKTNAPTKKRKKQDIDTIPVPRSPKKPKRGTSPSRALSSTVDFSLVAEFHDAGEIGNVLLRSIFAMVAASKGVPKFDAHGLGYYLVRAASAIPQIVRREVERISTEEALDNYALSSALAVSSRAISAILLSYGKLSASSGLLGYTNHAVVKMFKDLLRDFELLSTDGMDNAVLAKSAPASASSPAKSKEKGKSSKTGNLKANPGLSLYTNFLASIIDQLDPKLVAHKDIYEGFAYCLIEKLGERLYTATFGQPRGQTLADEIKQGAPDDAADESENFVRHAQQQIQLEAPYLVHLLSHLMLAAPAYLGSVKGRKRNAKSATKNSLTSAARECLQRTLINCIFGTEGQDSDDLFKDSLTMPKSVEPPVPIPKIKEANAQEWFKEELWRLLGWEILATDEES